ncbi:MAG TPA: hypothetical protein VFI24_06885 [Pyrinomonadaceae bacterium]|nr:hypothetical protein [Pyrinomonadaceae bacterium]
MNLIFPTQLPFPTYPVPPTEQGEEGASSFLEALAQFFQHLLQQHASTRRYFQAAEFYCQSANQENQDRTQSADASQQAITFVIQNIIRPTRGEYVWDPAQNRWVLRVTPA